MEDQEKNKTIKTFAIASFLNDMGSDIIYPIWPLFVTQILGANMAILGLLDGLGEALVSISQAVSGYLSDRLKKRKIFIWIGYFMGGLSRIGYGLSTTYIHLIPFRILDRAGKIRSAPRDAIVADYSNRKNRGRNFGLLRTADHLGALVGIIICISLFKVLGYRNLFLLAAIPSIIGASLIISKIKEPKTSDNKIFKGIKLSDFNKNFQLFLILSAFFALGSFSYSFLLIYAKEFGFNITFVPVLYLIFTVFASLFSLPFGKLADKIGRKKVLLISYLLWGLMCLNFLYLIYGYPQILANFIIKTFNLGGIHLYSDIIKVMLTFTGIVTAFILYGLHKAALDPVQKTLVSELAPADFRASALGGYQMVVGLCALPSSLVAGILWDKIGLEAPLLLSLALTLIALTMLNFIKESKSLA